MTDDREALLRELASLRLQLAEAQETLHAIQDGEVDAIVVTDAESPRVYTLDAVDKPYRLLVEQMSQGAAALAIDGTVLHCNERFAQLAQVSLEDLRGRRLQSLIDAESLPLFDALLRDGLAAGVEGEVILRRADRSRLPVFLGVSALHEFAAGVCLLVADVSEQKRRERLVADEAMARSILEQVGDAVVVCDSAGVVLRASRAAHDLCGHNPLMRPFDEVFPLTRLGVGGEPDSRLERVATRRNEALRGLEVGFQRAHGQRAELLLNASPLVAAGGETLGMVITLTDITLLRQAQGELQRRATELQEADRRKDEFLAMLAHELRNPLSPIRSSLQIMQLKGLADPTLRKCRDVIERQTIQLTRLVDDLLEVSRISSGKIQLRLEPVDLAMAINQGVETSRPAVDAKRHRLSVVVPEAAIVVLADPVRIAQVVGNLLNNAAKYTEEGGAITVRVERSGPDGVIRVSDSGLGIPQEMLGRVFDLFTQVNRSLDRSQGGLGIGLALVKRLVVMHGGKVEAHSEGTGRGSEFVVRLPLWSGAGEDALAPASKLGAPPLRRRVLVVDDSGDAVDILAELLGLLGHEVRTAMDGVSALTAAAEFRPDIMLCDIGLPLLNGYEVVAELRTRPELANTRFVALTGYGRAEDRETSRAAGFHDHLVKPFDLAKLEAILLPPTSPDTAPP